MAYQVIFDERRTRRTSVAQGLFYVGRRAGPWPRRVRQLQKCIGPRRYSPKEGCLRCHAINLTPPRRVKACEDGPLRLEEINHRTRMPNSQLKKPLHEAGIDEAVFVIRPTKRESVAQGLFKGGSRRRPGGPDASDIPKNASGPWHSP